MYEYSATIRRVVDGDTVDVLVDLGFSVGIKERVRLHGIDTPESRTRDLREKKFGKIATVPYHGQNKKEIRVDHEANWDALDMDGRS